MSRDVHSVKHSSPLRYAQVVKHSRFVKHPVVDLVFPHMRDNHKQPCECLKPAAEPVVKHRLEHRVKLRVKHQLGHYVKPGVKHREKCHVRRE